VIQTAVAEHYIGAAAQRATIKPKTIIQTQIFIYLFIYLFIYSISEDVMTVLL